jgi:hypothetical protein
VQDGREIEVVGGGDDLLFDSGSKCASNGDFGKFGIINANGFGNLSAGSSVPMDGRWARMARKSEGFLGECQVGGIGH